VRDRVDRALPGPAAIRTVARARHRGRLLRELESWRLLEKGARFPGKVEPLSAGLDMRNSAICSPPSATRAHPDYGAWWFFAFPIAAVRRFPLPFFVRGDDVSFGLDNGFDIVTLNGIACFGEEFSAKHGPLTAYLDTRYHVVLALLARRGTAARVFWVGSRLFVKPLTSYLSSIARAVTLALRHTLEGPEFFREHLEMAAVRSEIAAWPGNEKMSPSTGRRPSPPRARAGAPRARCAASSAC